MQEMYVDMTEEQLNIFWSFFRNLDPDRMHYEKPPINWRPPNPSRDMSEEELQAYWAAFRTIIQNKADEMPEQTCQPDTSCDMPNIAPAAVATVKPVCGRIRVRGKTSQADVDRRSAQLQNLEEARSKNASKRAKVSSESGAPSKRKYEKKAEKTYREGKKPCVSIWMKVELCKDACLLCGVWCFNQVLSYQHVDQQKQTVHFPVFLSAPTSLI